MVYSNPIPVFRWEEQLADSLGVTASLLRFAISFFASVPINAGLRLVKDPKGKLLVPSNVGLGAVFLA